MHTFLQQHPELLIYEHDYQVYMLSPEHTDIAEIRDKASEKLFAHAFSKGQLFQCPDCKYRFVIPYEQWDDMLEQAQTDHRAFIVACIHCNRRVVYIDPGPPPMIWGVI